MKVLKAAIIAVVVSTSFLACKKDSSKPAPSVAGKYVGAYGFDNENPSYFYSLNIRADGVIQEIGESSGSPTGEGTWQMNGNTLTATYTMLFEPYNKYSVIATFDEGKGTLTGTWGYDSNGSDGGKMAISKQ